MLHRAMSSVHDQLAECEQRNGRASCGCNILSGMMHFKTTDSLISANAKVCTSL